MMANRVKEQLPAEWRGESSKTRPVAAYRIHQESCSRVAVDCQGQGVSGSTKIRYGSTHWTTQRSLMKISGTCGLLALNEEHVAFSLRGMNTFFEMFVMRFRFLHLATARSCLNVRSFRRIRVQETQIMYEMLINLL